MHVLQVFIAYTTKKVFDAHKTAKNLDKTPNITKNGQKWPKMLVQGPGATQR